MSHSLAFLAISDVDVEAQIARDDAVRVAQDRATMLHDDRLSRANDLRQLTRPATTGCRFATYHGKYLGIATVENFEGVLPENLFSGPAKQALSGRIPIRDPVLKVMHAHRVRNLIEHLGLLLDLSPIEYGLGHVTQDDGKERSTIRARLGDRGLDLKLFPRRAQCRDGALSPHAPVLNRSATELLDLISMLRTKAVGNEAVDLSA